MADFIVQEEDGSLLELEDDSGFLERQEAGGVESSASFTSEGAGISILASPPPPGVAYWKAGVIDTPAATGLQPITELGGEPKFVMFFGTNWTTEDVAVSTSGTGLFRGWGGPKWDDPGTIQNYMLWTCQTGVNHNSTPNKCLGALDFAGTTNIYQAALHSLDADGFTLDWNFATAGYKVVYVALMQADNVAVNSEGDPDTYALGFKAGAGVISGIANAGALSSYTTSYSAAWAGSVAYPGSVGGGSWQSADVTSIGFPSSAFQQYISDLLNQPPGTVISQVGSFVGPFLTPTNVTAIPSGVGLEDFTLDIPSAGSFAAFAVWDNEDSRTGRVSTTPDNAGEQVTIAGLPFAPGLVLGYSNSDEPRDGLGSSDSQGVRGAMGFSVATSDGFQWSALVDGKDSRGAFQSFQYGFADRVSGTSTHAGTVTLTSDGFVMETEVDDLAATEWVWHAFGYPERRFMWIPHIYRRVRE